MTPKVDIADYRMPTSNNNLTIIPNKGKSTVF